MSKQREALPEVIWKPQEGPQTALIACPVFEVFYGGARGGGKTEAMLGDWLEHQQTWGRAANGAFFRRTLPQLSDVISRAMEIFIPLGAKWNEQKKRFVFPNGARLSFRFLEKDKDAQNYQGHSYTRIYIEEATNFPSPDPINKLRATIRSTKVPQNNLGMRLTGNPGGPGHAWVKVRYIDPAPAGLKIIKEQFKNPYNGTIVELERVFIPSLLKDNKLLMENNPYYLAQLQQTGSKQLVSAWLKGDWSIIDGAFFTEFGSIQHVLPAETIRQVPPHSTVFRAFDWGFAKPFCCGWYAVADGKWGCAPGAPPLPRGALVKIQEWYGSDGKPNNGLRLDAGPVGEGIKQRDEDLLRNYGLRTRIGPADPSIFIRDGGPSIAEMMIKHVVWMRADNKRVNGWQLVRRRLVGTGGAPMLYFLETCQDTIRTLPSLQHDEKNAEDLDTDGEDHAADETRYACASRPQVVDEKVPDVVNLASARAYPTYAEMLAASRKKRLLAEA